MKKECENKESKKYYSIMCFSLILILISIITLDIITPDKEFSESENRILAKNPKFTIERFFEGRFTSKYEKYKVDQFINRDMWIKIKSSVDNLLGKNGRDTDFIWE